jgi:hypothetical protein
MEKNSESFAHSSNCDTYSDLDSVTDYSDFSDMDSDFADNDEYYDWVANDADNTRCLLLGAEQEAVLALIEKDKRWRRVRECLLETSRGEQDRQMANMALYKAQVLRKKIKAIQRIAAKRRRVRTAFSDAAKSLSVSDARATARWVRIRTDFKHAAKQTSKARLQQHMHWRRVRAAVVVACVQEAHRVKESRCMEHADAEARWFKHICELSSEFDERNLMKADDDYTHGVYVAWSKAEDDGRHAMDVEEAQFRQVMAGWAAAEKAERGGMHFEEFSQKVGRRLLRKQMLVALKQEATRRLNVAGMAAEEVIMKELVFHETLLAKRKTMRQAIMVQSRKLRRDRNIARKLLLLRRAGARRAIMWRARVLRNQARTVRIGKMLRRNLARIGFINHAAAEKLAVIDRAVQKRELKGMRKEEKYSVRSEKRANVLAEFATAKANKLQRRTQRASIRQVRATKRKQVMIDVDAIRAMRRQTGEDVSDSDEKAFSGSESESRSDSSRNSDGSGGESSKSISSADSGKYAKAMLEQLSDSSELESDKEADAGPDKADFMAEVRAMRAKKSKGKSDDGSGSDKDSRSGSSRSSYSGSSRSSHSGSSRSSFSGSSRSSYSGSSRSSFSDGASGSSTDPSVSHSDTDSHSDYDSGSDSN